MTKNRILKKILLHAGVIIAVILYCILPIKCPIEYLFHIPCPTCGMTRSFIALITGKFAQSFALNPMTVPFAILVLFAIHKDLFKINKIFKDLIIIVGTVIAVLVYLFRILL